MAHWTDGDLFSAGDGSSMATARDLLPVQWGAPHPMFADKRGPSPRAAAFVLALSIRIKRLFRRAPKGISA